MEILNKRRSIKNAIILTYCLLTIILVSCISFFVYYEINSIMAENLLKSNINLSMKIINKDIPGEWRREGKNLYKDNVLINNNFSIVDNIKSIVKGDVTIFLDDTRINTTVNENGRRKIGTVASEKVIEAVLKNKKDFKGTANVVGMKYLTYYIPIKNSSNEVIGMFFIGYPKSYVFQMIKDALVLIIIVSLILLIIGCVTFYLIINKKIISPIKKLNDYLALLANLDLRNKIDRKLLRRKDEIGQMFTSFENVSSNIRNLINELNRQSRTLLTSSENLEATSEEMMASSQELATTMNQVATGATSQAQDLTDIVSSLSDLTNNIANVYEELKNVKEETENAENKANIGKQEMDILVESINDIKNAFELVVNKVGTLTSSVKEIRGITEIISAISEQTNLLALNAAIEAARAGEHGRGFTVVAEEVRKLAEESRQSTEKIVNLVSSITRDTDEVISTSKEVEASVKEQAESVENTVKSFGDILVSVENIAPLMKKTYDAMDEIVKSKDIVMEKAEQVSAVTEENSAATEEVAASSEELTASSEEIASTAHILSEIAMKMKDTVNRFKV